MSDDRPVIPAGTPYPPASGVQEARPLPWSRKLAALFIALIADAPPVCLLSEAYPIVFDLVVAALLWLVLGRSKLLAMALLLECIPAVGLAPTWTAYVLFEIIAGKGGKKAPQSPAVPGRP
jgi:hypothetical protein